MLRRRLARVVAPRPDCVANCVAQVRRGEHLQPRDDGRALPARRRDDRLLEPETRRLAQPSLQTRHRAQLPQQPHLSDSDDVTSYSPIAQRRGQGQAQRQVQAWVFELEAAGQIGIYIVAAKPDPRTAAEDGHEQGHAVGVDTGGSPPVSYTHLTLPTNREV